MTCSNDDRVKSGRLCYNAPSMNASDIKDYAQRDWAGIAALDQSYWTERYRKQGPEAGWQAAAALRQHVKSVRPEWPDAAARAADFQHHVRFKQLLDRAAHGLKPG